MIGYKYKTYLAAAGFVLLALWQLYRQHYDQAYEALMLALAAAGLRHAIAKGQ